MQEECNKETTAIGNGKWTTCKQIIKTAAAGVFKEESEGKSNNWFDQECEDVKQRKKATYNVIIHKHYNRQTVERDKELRRQEKKLHNT